MTKGDIPTCRAAVSDPNDSRVPAKLVPKGKAEGPARTTQVQSNEIDKGDGQPSLDENGDGDGDGRSKYESFDDMNLKDNLLRGIYSYGFEKPSAIQARAIIPVTTGRDVIAQAQSGSGKTATFTIAALQRVQDSLPCTQILMLSPTRELAQQTSQVVRSLSIHLGTRTCECIGGTRYSRDEMRDAQIVIATPGRVLDVIQRCSLRVDKLSLLILDEADEMLSMGFRDIIYDIFQLLPDDMQVCIFSATLPRECLEITHRFMRDPIHLLVKQEQVTLEGIKQFYVAVGEERFKFDVLVDLYSTISITQAIIFCNSRRKVDWLTDMLSQRDFVGAPRHGNMTFAERQEVMQRFRTGQSRILITTNLVARGIDVQTVSLVLNYDLPVDRESYVHRIGRSGRFGRKGVAINFVTDGQVRDLRDIESFYHTEVKEMPMDVAQFF
jgi:translation initiation factor 4A